MSSVSHGSKADVTAFTGMKTETPGHGVSGRMHGPHSTVACTTISGSSMSFLLWTILSSS